MARHLLWVLPGLEKGLRGVRCPNGPENQLLLCHQPSQHPSRALRPKGPRRLTLQLTQWPESWVVGCKMQLMKTVHPLAMVKLFRLLVGIYIYIIYNIYIYILKYNLILYINIIYIYYIYIYYIPWLTLWFPWPHCPLPWSKRGSCRQAHRHPGQNTDVSMGSLSLSVCVWVCVCVCGCGCVCVCASCCPFLCVCVCVQCIHPCI